MSPITEEQYNWLFKNILEHLVEAHSQLAAKDKLLATKDRQIQKLTSEKPPRCDNTEVASSLEAFLDSEMVEYGPDYHILQTEFQNLYKKYCKSHDVVARALKKDYYEEPFTKKYITKRREEEFDLIANITKPVNRILGVRASAQA